ncbi:four-helix bundle copper-binding protein [Georgenia sp. MJ206]|uniref:four-helix bundle copper-binding protein n=1 Tax=Georgenia wangjunii TaxID=3117730 RepID=UPI002F269DE4
MQTTAMMKTHPAEPTLDPALLARTIDALVECAQACTACADACLSEEMVAELRACIRRNLDCADICAATATVLTRQAGYDESVARAQLQACVLACRSCGDECASHAEMHEHCKVCAEACRRCEEACAGLLAVIG